MGVINTMAIHILAQDFPKRMYPERLKTAEVGFKRSGISPNGKSPSLQRENQTKRNRHFS